MSIAQRSINVLRRYANTKGQDQIAAGVFETTANEIERMIDRIAELEAQLEAARKNPFQRRVDDWMLACFGEVIARDVTERNHRFLEEALELVQSTGCTASEAHQLVDYVYGRPVGETNQEIGGVMVTLSALCSAVNAAMQWSGDLELMRISAPEVMTKIRAKQAAKPKHSPLPIDAAIEATTPES